MTILVANENRCIGLLNEHLAANRIFNVTAVETRHIGHADRQEVSGFHSALDFEGLR